MRYNYPLIAKQMDQQGLTDEALSRKAGVSPPTAKKVRLGMNVEVDTLLAIADALKIKRKDLLTNGVQFRRAVKKAKR